MTPREAMGPMRRDQIVRATIRCLARDGYAGLTMKRVAREAGLSQGILHYYFRDKRDILGAAAERVIADLDRRVAAAASRAHSAPERLRALIRTCFAVATRDREYWTVFIEFWGEVLHDRRLATLNRRSYTRARRLIARGLARGIRSGEFRAVVPEEAALVVLGMVDGMSLQLTFDRAALRVSRAQRLAEEALLAYLAPPAPARRPRKDATSSRRTP